MIDGFKKFIVSTPQMLLLLCFSERTRCNMGHFMEMLQFDQYFIKIILDSLVESKILVQRADDYEINRWLRPKTQPMIVPFNKPLVQDYVKSHVSLAIKRAEKSPNIDVERNVQKILKITLNNSLDKQEIQNLVAEVKFER